MDEFGHIWSLILRRVNTLRGEPHGPRLTLARRLSATDAAAVGGPGAKGLQVFQDVPSVCKKWGQMGDTTGSLFGNVWTCLESDEPVSFDRF